MKTLKIPDELHRKIKVFCAENNLKINEWVEKELKKILVGDDTNEGSRDKDKPV
jgi:hypothetical protein